jgi:hypothetical protein
MKLKRAARGHKEHKDRKDRSLAAPATLNIELSTSNVQNNEGDTWSEGDTEIDSVGTR